MVAEFEDTALLTAFAPDALYPLGGYPGNDDDGRALQAQRRALVNLLTSLGQFFGEHLVIAFNGALINHIAAHVQVGDVGSQ